MAFTCGFYNSINHDRMYNAVQMSQIFDGIINDGVYMGFMDHFMVTPADGMNVQVGSGRAWFNHTWSYNDSPYMIKLADSSVGLNRIDAVCLVIDISDEVRENSIEVVQGTPVNATPSKPDLIDTDTKFYHPLAYITVNSEVTVITEANIENAVGTVRTPFVTGIIETIDIDELVVQWQAQWEEWASSHQNEYLDWIDDQESAFTSWTTEQENAFNAWVTEQRAEYTNWIQTNERAFDLWFESIRGKLDGDVAGHLQNEIDDLDDQLHSELNSLDERLQYTNQDNTSGTTVFTKNSDGEVTRSVTTYSDGSTRTVVFKDTSPYVESEVVVQNGKRYTTSFVFNETTNTLEKTVVEEDI